MKIHTVVGARPNFIKLDPDLKQTIIHTGQHYDKNMSDVFFNKKPKYNLGLTDVGAMIDELRKIFAKKKPDMVIVFGDTNSSLAGALAASYEKIPVAHIEAGLRSYTNMPEEINRKMIDHLSTVLLCPTENAIMNLAKEGIKDHVYLVGDPMFDALTRHIPIKRTKNYREYILLTVHRESNSSPKYINSLLKILEKSGENYIFPAHPRIKKILGKVPSNIKVIEPVDYKKMLELESNAKKIITDSGGVQREGAWMNIPVILMRDETEWVELVEKGSVKLSNLNELENDIINFKGKVISAPNKGVNKRIREIIFKYL